MKGPADIYRAEILRAVLGDKANECKVVDMARLNTITAHLVDCEDAKAILRTKGYGTAGMTFVELAKSMPENVRGILRDLFRSHKLRAPASLRYPDLGEVHDTWSAR
jgi:hypothetical protein